MARTPTRIDQDPIPHPAQSIRQKLADERAALAANRLVQKPGRRLN